MSHTQPSDEYILQLLRAQHSAELGFRLLMQKYQQPLYRVARRILREHEDANDVLQNSFIKVWRSIHTFAGKAQLYTWLYRIVTNEALTFLQQQKRKATQSIEAGEVPLIGQIRADEPIDGAALQARLQMATSQLPEKQRLVFEMRYFEEMPYEEMAQLLDTSVGALKASYHHAVKKVEHYFNAIEMGEL
ncbi:MAG TPA: RNA polymerase sigma factor [Saprospiraceae bacterium]|nr:RNA polymerase sigma factor [Saprospiraceae bacterium]HMP23456.1 RNA polymerase sigma factor [Saprospiraceae bacterium]